MGKANGNWGWAARRAAATCAAVVGRMRARPEWGLAFGVASAVTGALAGFAFLGPDLGRPPYLAFWSVVMAAALVGGVSAGLAAVVLSALFAEALAPPRESADWLALAAFLGAGGLVVGVIELLFRAHGRTIAAQQGLLVRSQLADIVESSSDPILSKTFDGTITSWNPAASELFGYGRDEVIGQPIASVLIPPERLKEEADIVARLRRGECIRQFETTRLARDGRVLDVSLTISPIHDAAGFVIGASTIVRDITDRKRAEHDLLASRERVRLAAETTGVGVWEWNLRTGRVVWDAQMFRIYGVQPTAGGVVGYDVWASAVLPEDLPRQEDLMRRPVGEGGVNRREFRIRRRDDGAVRVVEAVDTLRYDRLHQTESMLGTNLDITERRRAEDALRLSQGRLLAAANAAGLTYTQFDFAENRVRRAENFGQIMGYLPRTPPEGGPFERARLALLEKVVESDRPAANAMCDRVLAGIGGALMFRVLGEDGAVRRFDASWAPELDREGRVVAVFVTFRDVTAEATSRSALEEAKARADEILESIADGFYAIDDEWRFTYFNRRAEEMLRLRRDDVFGRSFFDVFPMVRDTEVQANYATVMAERRPLAFETVSPIMGRWVAFSVYPTREGGLFVHFRDVERRKAAEKALLAAKAEAERANLAKSKFLAAASHDLRQPVQTLVLLLALIQRQVRDNPKAVETAQKMTRSLDGLNGLLTAILDISRLDAGVVRPAFASVSLEPLLDDLAAEYGPWAESRGLKLRVVPSRLQALADPALLERILRNLVENALRYTQAGAVLVGVRRRGDCVRIDVVDTGIGIPEHRREDIFEEFVQIGNSGRDLGLGLGLGLAIVGRIAALLGADIELDSTLGRGSRFSLRLPRALSEWRPTARPVEVADAGGRLIVIEDNSILLHSLEGILQAWGYDTIGAATGEEALERAEAEGWRFDAILSDYRLGAGMSGLDAARALRRGAGRPAPVMILTGDTATDRISDIASSGFSVFHKPIDADALRRKLAELMLP